MWSYPRVFRIECYQTMSWKAVQCFRRNETFDELLTVSWEGGRIVRFEHKRKTDGWQETEAGDSGGEAADRAARAGWRVRTPFCPSWSDRFDEDR